MSIRLIEETITAMPAHIRDTWQRVLGHTHTYSGSNSHGGTVMPPENYRNLANWAGETGVDALGMGSPYTPELAAQYRYYENEGRASYYAPGFDQQSLCGERALAAMLASVNGFSRGRTLFYLDNETPKGRYGHLWWVGYHCDYPAWHDYDQEFDRWMTGEAQPGALDDEPMPYTRRPYREIVAVQRAKGALGMWAHPTSWWYDGMGRFITNIATEMPAHVFADGFIDGLVVMGYHAWRPQYQELWYALLDRGYRVPGVAEMDCGLSQAQLWDQDALYLNHVYVPDALSPASLVRGFQSGRTFVSSGPHLELRVDQQVMGSTIETGPDRTHSITLTVWPAKGSDCVGRVELVGNGGQVVWSKDNFPGGELHLTMAGLSERGYVLARCFGPGEHSDAADFRRIQSVAVTNPVYLHPRGTGFTAPSQTHVVLTLRSDSPFLDGTLRCENDTGHLLETFKVRAGTLETVMPASGRLTFVTPDGKSHTEYLINANADLQRLQRHLYRGRFLQDFPGLEPGEVPLEAWQLDAHWQALQRVAITR